MAQGCKKDDNYGVFTPTSITSCSESTFQILISDMWNPTSITEDGNNNIIVLCDKNDETIIIKVDTNGNVIWNKSYPNIPGRALEVITLRDNSILFTSYMYNETEPIANLPVFQNVYVQQAGLSNSCDPNFEFAVPIDGYLVNSNSYLTKLDSNGNVMWTNHYAEGLVGGSSMFENSQGNICFVTMKLYGRIPEPVYDNYGVFQDTVLYPTDKNTLSFYTIGVNGNTLLHKEITNVYNSEYDRISTKINLQEINNYNIIQTEKNIMFLNSSGDIVKYEIIHEEYCTNINKSMCADGNTILVSGLYAAYDTTTMVYQNNQYIQQLSAQGNIDWEIANNDLVLDYYSDRFIANGFDDNNLKMYDNNGNLLWELTSPGPMVGIINCNKGITSALTNIDGDLIITRTNADGEF